MSASLPSLMAPSLTAHSLERLRPPAALADIAAKVVRQERLSFDDGLALWKSQSGAADAAPAAPASAMAAVAASIVLNFMRIPSQNCVSIRNGRRHSSSLLANC